MLANRGIDKLKTTRVDLKVDGIPKSMDIFFVVDADATYIQLGWDHQGLEYL